MSSKMKLGYAEIFVTILVPGILCYYASGSCLSVIEAFDVTFNYSSAVWQVNCCASLISSLLFDVDNVSLTSEEELTENGIRLSSTGGRCTNYTVDNLPVNFSGTLNARCNAEQGGFEHACQSKLHTIESLHRTATTEMIATNKTVQAISGNRVVDDETKSKNSSMLLQNDTSKTTSVSVNSTRNVTVPGHLHSFFSRERANLTVTPKVYSTSNGRQNLRNSIFIIVGPLTSGFVAAAVVAGIIGLLLYRNVRKNKKKKTPNDGETSQTNSSNAAEQSDVVSLPQFSGQAEELNPSVEATPSQQESSDRPLHLGSRRNNSLPKTSFSRNGDGAADWTQVLELNALPFHGSLEEGTLDSSLPAKFPIQCTDTNKTVYHSRSLVLVGERGNVV